MAAPQSMWKKGLFGCCDLGIEQILCLLMCAPCAYGKVMERLQIGSCLGCCIGGFCCSCCNRGKIRTIYNIAEEPSDSVACLCCPCAFLQEMQEVKIKEQLKFGLFGAITKENGQPLEPPKAVFSGFSR